MACNCSGNTYNIGMGCCVPVVVNADNYYTKEEIDKMLRDLVNELNNGDNQGD